MGPELGRLDIILLAIALTTVGLGSALATVASAGPTDCVGVEDDAKCNFVAVSLTGDADCHGERWTGGTVRMSLQCLAVSGTGTASGGNPVSPTGNCDNRYTAQPRPCFAARTEGDATGYYLAATPDGDAKARCLAVSGTGDARGGCASLSGARESVTREDCTPHGPISIRSDEMFKLGETVGVVNPGAEGTEEDPYVIEGWCIQPSGSSSSLPDRGVRFGDNEARLEHWPDVGENQEGLKLSGTDSHVVVRDNVVPSAQPAHPHGFDIGLRLVDAANVSVVANTISSNVVGMRAQATEALHVGGNDLSGNAYANLWLSDGATGTSIRNNTIQAPTGPAANLGVQTVGVDGLGIENNTIRGTSVGLRTWSSDGVHLANNTITHNDAAADLHSTEATLVDNELSHNEAFGVEVEYVDRTVELHRNNLHDNDGTALKLTSVSTTTDARDNWWGAASGPSGGVQDDCTDALADGEGQAIQIRYGEEDACFAPWLGGPNPQAGVASR